MSKNIFLFFCAVPWLCTGLQAQGVERQLAKAAERLLGDKQMQHATVSLYVVETATGKEVFKLNEQVGVAPASSQKIFTAAAALELLGPGYRYATTVMMDDQLRDSVLNGNIYIQGGGDPTLGSWRYKSIPETAFADSFRRAVREAGIRQVTGAVVPYLKNWGTQTVPDGWIWEDLGNYFGAGATGLNWHENQYDIVLRPGKRAGDKVEIARTEPPLYNTVLVNELRTGPSGSGDNSNIYIGPYGTVGYIRGTVPAKSSFTISGAMPQPVLQCTNLLAEQLKQDGITVALPTFQPDEELYQRQYVRNPYKTLYTHYSVSLDSIVYWFMQKSVNLYGEAFLKTIGLQLQNEGSTDAGVKAIRAFWADNGIDRNSCKIQDGSGLSPQNRVTTKAEVAVLQYARSRPWFSSFYNALPMYNDMHMKSGTIFATKAFAGYHTSKAGVEYAFSIIINNFDGTSADATQKIYRMLDELK
jgi:D-alanyl-D-alanine carboxypeptidase/D-alanyl-D-alanine-endopeptidase (penicillin-binding protein 4)